MKNKYIIRKLRHVVFLECITNKNYCHKNTQGHKKSYIFDIFMSPRGAGKREFVKQLLSLKCFIMTNPPERIVWFYGRH